MGDPSPPCQWESRDVQLSEVSSHFWVGSCEFFSSLLERKVASHNFPCCGNTPSSQSDVNLRQH